MITLGFRFRRSARLGPLRFNFGKSGLSSNSLGGRGASCNIPISRSSAPRTAVGLPGTGWSRSIEHRQEADRTAAACLNLITQLLAESSIGSRTHVLLSRLGRSLNRQNRNSVQHVGPLPVKRVDPELYARSIATYVNELVDKRLILHLAVCLSTYPVAHTEAAVPSGTSRR